MRTLPWYLIGLVLLAGCQQRTAMELLGTWEGRPDTSAARAEREEERYGKRDSSVESVGLLTESTVTDWENYDVGVTLDFQSRSEVSLTMSGEEQSVSGSWKMVQSGPVACTIAIETPTGEGDTPELRRYKLELDQDGGELKGFLMREVGADRSLGTLYFRRAE